MISPFIILAAVGVLATAPIPSVSDSLVVPVSADESNRITFGGRTLEASELLELLTWSSNPREHTRGVLIVLESQEDIPLGLMLAFIARPYAIGTALLAPTIQDGRLDYRVIVGFGESRTEEVEAFIEQKLFPIPNFDSATRELHNK